MEVGCRVILEMLVIYGVIVILAFVIIRLLDMDRGVKE